MEKIYRARIIFYLDTLGYKEEYYLCGSEDKIYADAIDRSNSLALRYIYEHMIYDEVEQEEIISCAGHTIVWEDISPLCMYALVDYDGGVCGVYPTRAEAEEMLLQECEDYADEVMWSDDPFEVFGRQWRWEEDYKWLMQDTARCFSIQEVPVFGVKGV